MDQQSIDRIVAAIHATPGLRGVSIGYYGRDSCMMLHQGNPRAANYGRVQVIVELVRPTGASAVGNVPEQPTVHASNSSHPPPRVANGSRVGAELAGAGVSCGLTVLAGIGVAGGVAAEGVSAGTSTFLVVMAWGGMITSGAACANGLVRSYQAVFNSENDSLARWDENEVYTWTFVIVDAAGLATGAGAAGALGRASLAALRARGGLASAQTLSNMTRAQRVAAVGEAVRRSADSPAGREALESALRSDGLSASRATRAAANEWIMRGGRNAVTNSGNAARVVGGARSVLTERSAMLLAAAVKEAFYTSLAAGGSALPGDDIGAASGVVNTVITHVIEQSP